MISGTDSAFSVLPLTAAPCIKSAFFFVSFPYLFHASSFSRSAEHEHCKDHRSYDRCHALERADRKALFESVLTCHPCIHK